MQEPLVKQTKKGKRTYYRWVASWREGGRCRKVYLGSCRVMSREAALQKARGMKAKALNAVPDEVQILQELSRKCQPCGGRPKS